MSIQVSHSIHGWKAKDDKGNVGSSTFDEGKEKAIARCVSSKASTVKRRAKRRSKKVSAKSKS